MNRVLNEIVNLMSVGLGNRFNTYYTGDVDPVPQSLLPALMVYPISTEVVAKSTSRDQYIYEIGIRAVINLKQYFNENGTGTVIDSMVAIANLMEERNADGTVVDNCVLGVLRNNVRGTDYMYNNDISIQYERVEGKEFPYVRANMRLKLVTNLIPRS